MTKIDLAWAVANKLRCSDVQAKEIVDSVLSCMKDGLAFDGKLTIRGWLGNFRIKTQGAMPYSRNPRTGEVVATPERQVVRFKASRKFRDSLNGGKENE